MQGKGAHTQATALISSLIALFGCADDTRLAPRAEASPLDAAAERISFDAARDRAAPRPPVAPDAAPRMSCNGSPVLCERTYDSVAFLATHHSIAVGSRWPRPTQGRELEEQFSIGGVRAFELEVHSNGGVLVVCAGSCADGNESLSNTLGIIRTFLERNPNDVLTLLIRNEATEVALERAFDSAGLGKLMHAQARDAPWPTLTEMIAADHRLVVFVEGRSQRLDAGRTLDAGEGGSSLDARLVGTADSADGSSRPAWMHAAEDWIWETAPSVGPDCVPATSDERRPLIVLNHYEAGLADAGLVAAHDPERVAARLRRCREDRGHRPTLVVVDFAEIGDPNGGVQIENGIR